jgi:hypothetical protein
MSPDAIGGLEGVGDPGASDTEAVVSPENKGIITNITSTTITATPAAAIPASLSIGDKLRIEWRPILRLLPRMLLLLLNFLDLAPKRPNTLYSSGRVL